MLYVYQSETYDNSFHVYLTQYYSSSVVVIQTYIAPRRTGGVSKYELVDDTPTQMFQSFCAHFLQSYEVRSFFPPFEIDVLRIVVA